MPRLAISSLLVVTALAVTSCDGDILCTGDATCPTAAPFCVDGVCATRLPSASEGEGEGAAAEGEGSEGEGSLGEGEGSAGEGEGSAGEGEGEAGDCRAVGCAVGLGCVDGGSVDVGVCVPPPNTPSSCSDANQFFARADQAPYVWRAVVVQDLTGSAGTAYGCSAVDEHGVMFNFQYLDDENDAASRTTPVTVRTQAGTTTPPPENIARADSVAGHVGSITAVVCLPLTTTTLAFAFSDDLGHTSNAICLP